MTELGQTFTQSYLKHLISMSYKEIMHRTIDTLRCIKAWEVHFLSQKYGVTKLLVYEKCFKVYNPKLNL